MPLIKRFSKPIISAPINPSFSAPSSASQLRSPEVQHRSPAPISIRTLISGGGGKLVAPGKSLRPFNAGTLFVRPVKSEPGETAGYASRAFLLPLCSSYSATQGVQRRREKWGTGFPKKGKLVGMQVACMSRPCIRPLKCDKLYEEAGAKGSP